ncbi:MAG: biotin/lipoyl-containing protein [Bacilli bacterium]
MKIYKVKVNGKVYEVELEEVTNSSKTIEVENNGEFTNKNVNSINSPLQGKIFKIPVSVGDSVKMGDVIIIIEAMKMESEVQTSKSGVVKKILVNVGDEVNSDQPLVIIE